MVELPKISIGEVVAGAGGIAIGAGLGYIAGKRSGRKKSRRRKKHKSRSVRKRSVRNKSWKRKRYTPYTARKRKDTSHKRIRYTSKGQPYIILANGRARFIKMSSAKRSHKQKGGRY